MSLIHPNNRFSFRVGARYAISRKHSQLVSFISRLSTAGLVIGVALLIVVMSVMNGFDRELREKILNIMPQGMIYQRDGVDDYKKLIEQVKNDPRVLAAAPFVQIQGLVSFHKKVAPVNLFGVDPQQETQLSVLPTYLPEGKFAELAQNPSAIILGKGVADKLQITVGEKITLIVPRAQSSSNGSSSDITSNAPEILILEVTAILNSHTEVDQSLALMNMQAASAISETPGRVTGVRLKVNDLFAASIIVFDILNDLPSGYFGSDWTHTHGNIYQAIHMSKDLVGMLLFLIIGIAAFNLVSTLVMVVVDKQGDIAILRTLGASTKQIMAIFMVQGGLIGLIGTLMGGIIGVLLSFVVTDLVAGIEKIFHFQFLHADVYPISYLPSDLHWSDVVQVVITALLISLIACIYPAWRASRVQPAEALRFE